MGGKRKVGTSREFKQKVAWVVLFLLLCVAVGAGWGALSDRAFGAAPTVVAGAPYQQMGKEQASEQQESAASCCPKLAKKLARKFRRGKIHHAHGFKPGKVFHAPRKARRVIVNKTYRYLKAHPGHLKQVPRPAGLRSGCESNERCFAYELYGEMVEDASCVSSGVPTNRAGTCLRTPESKLTKKQIQRLGLVTLCGGSVAFGAATSPLSGGATAFIAMWGAASCGWSFWLTFD